MLPDLCRPGEVVFLQEPEGVHDAAHVLARHAEAHALRRTYSEEHGLEALVLQACQVKSRPSFFFVLIVTPWAAIPSISSARTSRGRR